jgi:hypothetical protein
LVAVSAGVMVALKAATSAKMLAKKKAFETGCSLDKDLVFRHSDKTWEVKREPV